jgi:hypothetical protein
VISFSDVTAVDVDEKLSFPLAHDVHVLVRRDDP